MYNFCGVSIDYLTAAQQKAIKDQEDKCKQEQREQRMNKLKEQRSQLIADFKDLEDV